MKLNYYIAPLILVWSLIAQAHKGGDGPMPAFYLDQNFAEQGVLYLGNNDGTQYLLDSLTEGDEGVLFTGRLAKTNYAEIQNIAGRISNTGILETFDLPLSLTE